MLTLDIGDIMTAVSKAIENALGVSLSDMAIQIGATFILVIIVKIFFWDKITTFLEKRHELMETEFESAKTANQEAQDLQDKTSKEYHDLKAKSKGYLEKAKQKGEEERTSIIEKAKLDSNNMMHQAEQEIALEKKKAQSEIRKEVVDLATLMASKIIEKEIDSNDYQDLAVKNLESSEKV